MALTKILENIGEWATPRRVERIRAIGQVLQGTDRSQTYARIANMEAQDKATNEKRRLAEQKQLREAERLKAIQENTNLLLDPPQNQPPAATGGIAPMLAGQTPQNQPPQVGLAPMLAGQTMPQAGGLAGQTPQVSGLAPILAEQTPPNYLQENMVKDIRDQIPQDAVPVSDAVAAPLPVSEEEEGLSPEQEQAADTLLNILPPNHPLYKRVLGMRHPEGYEPDYELKTDPDGNLQYVDRNKPGSETHRVFAKNVPEKLTNIQEKEKILVEAGMDPKIAPLVAAGAIKSEYDANTGTWTTYNPVTDEYKVIHTPEMERYLDSVPADPPAFLKEIDEKYAKQNDVIGEDVFGLKGAAWQLYNMVAGNIWGGGNIDQEADVAALKNFKIRTLYNLASQFSSRPSNFLLKTVTEAIPDAAAISQPNNLAEARLEELKFYVGREYTSLTERLNEGTIPVKDRAEAIAAQAALEDTYEETSALHAAVRRGHLLREGESGEAETTTDTSAPSDVSVTLSDGTTVTGTYIP